MCDIAKRRAADHIERSRAQIVRLRSAERDCRLGRGPLHRRCGRTRW